MKVEVQFRTIAMDFWASLDHKLHYKKEYEKHQLVETRLKKCAETIHMSAGMECLSTLCYLERDGKYLMLHRTVKKNDVNKDKWIGVGGHFEDGESPEECVLREVKEETGYTLTSFRYRGLITFLSGDGVTEYISLFTADGFMGEPIACDEGQLEWVSKEKVWGLNIWEGDKIFFRLLDERCPFLSLKLAYDGYSRLVSAALNGQQLETLKFFCRREARTRMPIRAAMTPPLRDMFRRERISWLRQSGSLRRSWG